jgi:signal transduction histidine kinase
MINKAQPFNMNQMIQEAFSASNIEELELIIARRFQESLQADGVHLALWNEGRSQLTPAVTVGRLNKQVLQWVLYGQDGGPASQALQEGTLVEVPDIDSIGVEDLTPSNAGIILPLIARAQPLGVVFLSFENEYASLDENTSAMEMAAEHAAFVLATSLAFERERKRTRELETVRRVNLSLTSKLNLQDVLEQILAHALELVTADDAHIFLYDGEELAFGSARWAEDVQGVPFSEPRQGGLTYAVARRGERIVIPDVDQHPLYKHWKWGGAIVGLPLKIGERVVGVMNVAITKPHNFNQDELRSLELIADQAAVAIENARLFEESETGRARVELLYNLAQDLASTLNPQEILGMALARLCTDLGALSSEAFSYEPDSDRLQVRASYRDNGLALEELNAKLDLEYGRGWIGRAASERKAYVLEDVKQDPRWSDLAEAFPDVHSAVCAPVTSGEELWGVLAVFHAEPSGLCRDHVGLLEAVAHQLGLALSNAMRYQQIERRLAELTALRQVAQVVNRRLEMHPLLTEVVRQLGDVLGYPVVEIYLVDEEELRLGAALGGPMDEDTCHPLSAGIIGRAVRNNRIEYVPDVREDDDYVKAWEQTKAEIAVPLCKEEVVIGVLNVESPVLRGLTEDDVRLLTHLADHISIAVENAALYERLQLHAEQLEATVKERTAALAAALEQAQEADKLKTQFVSDVSHELRTPLSNILLYLELLASGKKDKFEAYLETLSRETDRLIGLIEDLLAISRLDTGAASPEFRPVDLNRMARSLVEDRKRLFSERELKVDMALQDELPQVRGDENMLVQVMANLMTNAMHYTPAGGWVTLSTGTHRVDEMSWVTLTVADTGLGIPEEEKGRLFERFFRGSASRQTTTPGTGLGLAICKEIMDRHAGKITVDSQKGQGSAFTIWLPSHKRQESETD